VIELLRRTGRFAVTRPWTVLISWLVALIVLGTAAIAAGGALRDTMTANDTSSGRAMRMLRAGFPQAVGASAHVVARWDNKIDAHALADTERAVGAIAGVRSTQTRISDDGATAVGGGGLRRGVAGRRPDRGD
jgi:uncharacterized membrane protein YdfJ with MMPL/SSD domain